MILKTIIQTHLKADSLNQVLNQLADQLEGHENQKLFNQVCETVTAVENLIDVIQATVTCPPEDILESVDKPEMSDEEIERMETFRWFRGE